MSAVKANRPTLRAKLAALALSAALGLLLGGAQASSSSAAAPAWRLNLVSSPTNFAPGATSSGTPPRFFPQYTLFATNVGGAATSGPITITDTLPAGITPASVSIAPYQGRPETASCQIVSQTVTCTVPYPVQPGEVLHLSIRLDVSAGFFDGETVENQAILSGGIAPDAQVTTITTISSALPGFDFLPGAEGLAASALDADGGPATQAGSHPDTLAIDLGFPTHYTGNYVEGVDGGVRDISTYLPPGMVVDPQATPARCTEVQLDSHSCPDASVVGIANAVISIADPTVTATALYNMVPPPGYPAAFAFDIEGFKIHILGKVRAGDYVLGADTNDIPALFGIPTLGAHLLFWGDPSASIHDSVRGEDCLDGNAQSCPVTHQRTPLLSMPTSCTQSMQIDAAADSWEKIGDFHSRSALLTDSSENPTAVSGCAALGAGFNPTLQARPTTNLADSPSGLSVDLKVPQSNDLGQLATAHLKSAVVTLPPGLVLNPASANGLDGCSSSQIGIDPNTGVPDGNRPTCPDPAKIGTVEVDTPLLADPLPGSVYLAKPHDNPFDSLLAIYIVVDDPTIGVLVKLAGHVVPDPQTGQLTTTFDDNPQLPFTDFKLHFKSGVHAVLRTPAVCGNYATSSSLTPWSAPDSGPPATPSDTYSISQAPGGGGCATTQGALPNTPSFDAGSVSPIAGAHTPFVVNLRREDGSQNFSSVTLTPPPGLTGKLAGTPYCPESALAEAAAKSGRAEEAKPSCPAASQIGAVTVGAGAGPAPYYAQGKAYLTGPYKGAPLSMAIVTPATAGPYDLGTVVVKTALYVDPVTTQITAVSDPIPSILQGIQLDVRSAQVRLDKPNFTLNPTSCNPFTVSGQLVSTLSQAAPLSSRFQVAECGRLAFKPKLSLRLKGGTRRAAHPKLIATLIAKPGEANIARTAVTLPHSEFLDQGHIRTVCTRVQFAAGGGGGEQCPAGSIYGTATATTPLLDNPLTGNAYLRSSDNPLPDLVMALRGPSSQPIEVDLSGRTDSVKGALRNTFDLVPDAPVSKFRLELFGGKRGLVVNSANICASTYRATVLMDGQNGKTYDTNPVVANSCKRKGKGGHTNARTGATTARSVR